MNVLFLSIGNLKNLSQKALYTDLIRAIKSHNHEVYVVCANEKRNGQETRLSRECDIHVLRVKTGNITKTNLLEKGISTVLIESQFKAAIKKYFKRIKFDLVIYSTPPITFSGVIDYIKKRDGTKSYLLLKDIFPQNAVDIGMMKKGGVTGFLYKHFRKKEKKLYAISDRIGCMSQANVDYVLKHNPEVPASKVEVCPNSIEVQDMSVTPEERTAIREKYGIPQDKKVFVYGGNLGRPQGIPYLMDCLKIQADNADAYFLIVGDGTEYNKLEKFFLENPAENRKLLKKLPKEDYDKMVAACDVGMIFLDHRFTIPNFPSRLLSYMQAKIPVLACTDPNTDVGKVITEGGFGWWCESNSTEAFGDCVNKALSANLPQMGKVGFDYLTENYTVEKEANIIMDGLFVK